MDGSFLLGSVVLAIAAVVLFIVFYSLRLLKASRDAKEAAERFQVMMHKQGELRENFALMGESRGVSEGSETISSAQGGAPGGAASASQVYERKLGLARFSEEPIFLHRDEDGETVVQMAEKPPMPIRYLLDLDASKALKDIASQATLDFGGEWMILAEEDEEGRLVITRLG